MRRAEGIIFTLGPLGEARKAPALAQLVEVVQTPRQHLVHVRLVARVEDEDVVRRPEHAVQGDRELDDAEVGAEVWAIALGLANARLAADREAIEKTRAGMEAAQAALHPRGARKIRQARLHRQRRRGHGQVFVSGWNRRP